MKARGMNFKTLSLLVMSDRPLLSEALLALLQVETGFETRAMAYDALHSARSGRGFQDWIWSFS